MPEPRPRPPARLESTPAGWTVPEGWTPDNLGDCRSCFAAVLWCYTPAGRKAPVNPDGTSHFSTCPEAPMWRRPGVRGACSRASVAPTPAVRLSRLLRPGSEAER